MLGVGRIRFCGLLATLAVGSISAQEAPATPEEIPIGRCDRLPTVEVRADGRPLRFLLDTAATSLLNEQSFPKGESRKVRVSSWKGTSVTQAHVVHLKELVLGNYRIKDISLSAIDLSPISKACGGPIDGILGIDLLEKMGAIIDIQRRVALLQPGPANPAQVQHLKEYEMFTATCIEAFNRADAPAFGECFDPNVLHFTPDEEIQGRQEVMNFYDESFFHADPPARIQVVVKARRVLADTAWSAFEYTIELPERKIYARATMMARRKDGTWLIVSLHESLLPTQAPPNAGTKER